MEKFTFTVGKLDAGMAILIGERAHLIEFPSILLPPGVSSGSIVNISVNRNQAAEKAHLSEFWALQDQILNEYGIDTPKAPELKLRHVTQTSATLEWPKLELAKADLRALEIYKNGQRLALIPNPKSNTSTKLSSLQSNEEYSFQLVLKTTAGVYPSNIIKVRTHTMNDTSGISVCFGSVQDDKLVAHAKAALKQMNAKWSDTLEIDTTHFVCQSAGPAENNYSPSAEYQKAIQSSLPIVQPQWVLACLKEKKLVPVSTFQLGAATPAQYQPQGEAPEEFRKRSRTPVHQAAATEVPQLQPAQTHPGNHDGQNGQNARNSQDALHDGPSSGSDEPATDNNATPASSGLSQAPEAAAQQSEPAAGVVSEVRARSPKPEADGKLDRGFKFPSSSPPPDEQATVSGDIAVDNDPIGGIAIGQASSSAPETDHQKTSRQDEVKDTAVVERPEAHESALPSTSNELAQSASLETTQAQNELPRPEPKKTDPDVDVAARQWLSGQKHVDDTGESASQHSTRILDEVLDHKAAKAADLESEFKLDKIAEARTAEGDNQGIDHGEADSAIEKPAAEPPHSVESSSAVEVVKDSGEAVKVDEPATPEPVAESGIEVQKDSGSVVPVSQEDSTEESQIAEASKEQQQQGEGEGAEEANDDDDDETPANSAVQTPTESPMIPDAATAVTGGGKKKKNKKKSKK